MESIWSMQTKLASYPALEGNLNTDVAVIGGGMAGLLTAYFLQQQGAKTIVLEAQSIAGGQTKNTTAKITAQHHLIYHHLIKCLGREQALMYAKANQEAVMNFRKLVEKLQIACHFEEKSSYVYTTENPQEVEMEASAAQQLGLNAFFTTKTGLPFPIRGAVRMDHQAQFHPLEFIKGLIQELTIYENTFVHTIEGRTIRTLNGSVQAKAIVVATHYPFLNVPGFYFMRMHQERSYVVALKNAKNVDGMYIDAANGGYSLRNYENLLLLGGGNHRTGENSAGGKYKSLASAARQWFPQSDVLTQWSAQDCITLDKVPYIGHYCLTTPDLYVATGFCKWGMTGSMVAAKLISEKILGHQSPYEEVFTPQRFKMTASLESMLKDGYQAAKGIGRRFFQLPDALLRDLPLGHGGIIEYNGEKIGVYKDVHNNIHAVYTKCPHLGCQLEWNPDERSWDCPCHGSRFDYRGNLMDNPAMEPLERPLDTAKEGTESIEQEFP